MPVKIKILIRPTLLHAYITFSFFGGGVKWVPDDIYLTDMFILYFFLSAAQKHCSRSECLKAGWNGPLMFTAKECESASFFFYIPATINDCMKHAGSALVIWEAAVVSWPYWLVIIVIFTAGLILDTWPLYLVKREQVNGFDAVRKRDGGQAPHCDGCPERAGQVTCHLVRQAHGRSHCIGVDETRVWALGCKGHEMLHGLLTQFNN